MIKAKEVRIVKEVMACDLSPVAMFTIYMVLQLILQKATKENNHHLEESNSDKIHSQPSDKLHWIEKKSFSFTLTGLCQWSLELACQWSRS